MSVCSDCDICICLRWELPIWHSDFRCPDVLNVLHFLLCKIWNSRASEGQGDVKVKFSLVFLPFKSVLWLCTTLVKILYPYVKSIGSWLLPVNIPVQFKISFRCLFRHVFAAACDQSDWQIIWPSFSSISFSTQFSVGICLTYHTNYHTKY